MKKSILILLLLTILAISFLNAQTTDNDNEGNTNDGRYIVQTSDDDIIRFGLFFPDNDIVRDRTLTKDEYIFKTYFLDKLLKSNRILY